VQLHCPDVGSKLLSSHAFCADLCPCSHTFARDKIQNSRWPWSNIANNNKKKPIIVFLFARTQFTENTVIAKKVQVGVRFKDVS